MSQVDIGSIVEHLDYGLKRALEAAVEEVLPNAQFERNQLYRAFVRAVRRKCGTWEDVPTSAIRP